MFPQKFDVYKYSAIFAPVIRFLLLIVAMLAFVSTFGQRKIMVLDMETRLPVEGVTVRVDSVATVRTNYLGEATIPQFFRNITFTHMKYVKERITFSEMADTMYLLSRSYTLDEVVVTGIGPDLKHSMQRAHDNMLEDSKLKFSSAGVAFDFGYMLDKRGRRDRKHLKKAKKILREWDAKI